LQKKENGREKEEKVERFGKNELGRRLF